MTNQSNPAFPVVKQGSSHNSATPRQSAKSLVLALCLSILLALGIGAMSDRFVNKAITQHIAPTESSKPSIPPALQQQLLLELTFLSGVTALLSAAIATLLSRRPSLHSSKPQYSEQVLLLEDIASQSQPVNLNYLYKQLVDGAQETLSTQRATLINNVAAEARRTQIQKIMNLRETVEDTAKKVKRLGESSREISKVVSLINQIALQTNLLALNAGIEAARAGEEDQSFAVVAKEVSELAARSSVATQEIEHIVENIQLETSQVVEAMERGTTQVVEGSQLIEDTKLYLGRILDVSRQIDQLVQSISSATVSQVETSCTLTDLIKEMTKVSEWTATSSHQISSSLQETVDIAQQLQSSVEVFKVDSANN